MKTFFQELLQDMWTDAKHYWWLIPVFSVALIGFVWLNNMFFPPPKPKYWTIKHTDGVYTTDTLTHTPVGCVTIPRYTLCGDMVITEKEGKLPNESFK